MTTAKPTASQASAFRAYTVGRESAAEPRAPSSGRRTLGEGIVAGVQPLSTDALPAGSVTIRVAWSSVNYKDALAAKGHPGVARKLPHIPGIDAVGKVIACASDRFSIGQSVIVTGNELGAGCWGGWSDQIRVPDEWVVSLPTTMSARESMIHGTAGFTAAQCLMRIQHTGVRVGSGPVLVTGATGGVGCLAVQLLAKAGYEVVASTGKQDAVDWLIGLGAARVIGRDALVEADQPDRPLCSAQWAAAVDTVGGSMLAAVVRATQPHGCVACCGMVAGVELPLTVMPFILRGVTLAGVTSQNCPQETRRQIWQLLANEWRVDVDRVLTETVELEDVGAVVDAMLAGRHRGRTLVRVGGE